MYAEKRNRRYELYFHLLLATYSISAIGYSIIASGQSNALSDNVFLFLSVCTLSLSLLIFGFRFGETAAQHRACYLSLHKLRFENHTPESLSAAYVGTIGSLPNHTTTDFLNLAIDDLFSEQQKLQTADGDNYKFSWFERLKFAATLVFLWISATLLFTPALLIMVEAVCPSWLSK